MHLKPVAYRVFVHDRQHIHTVPMTYISIWVHDVNKIIRDFTDIMSATRYFLHQPSDVMVSSLCSTRCAIIRLMLIRFSVMSLVVCARPSLVVFLRTKKKIPH